MHGAWSILTVAALLLAGCSDAPGPAPDTQEFEGIVVEGVVAIRGIVVDAAVVPIVGAGVTVQGTSLQATTNDKGAFVFTDLEPGLYVLDVRRAGFYPVTIQAPVTQEEPPLLRVVMEHDVATALYSSTAEFQGFLQCGVGFVAGTWSVCQAPNGVQDITCDATGVCTGYVMSHRGIIEVPVDRVPTWTQAEAVWEASQPGAQNLLWQGFTRTPGTLEFNNGTSVSGPSPAVISWDEENNTKLDIGGAYDLVFQVYPTRDVGSIVIEQEVALFVTAFYNYLPPEAWLFIRDGEARP